MNLRVHVNLFNSYICLQLLPARFWGQPLTILSYQLFAFELVVFRFDG